MCVFECFVNYLKKITDNVTKYEHYRNIVRNKS